MRKIIAIVLSVLMCCFIFAGCSEKEAPEDRPERFVEINEEVKYDSSGFESFRSHIYADKETGVMYIFISRGNRAGITVLLDSDGKPLIYDFEKETQ